MLCMKHISIREFQTNVTQHLEELPIVLTKYNKPVAMVVPHVETNATTRVAPPTPVVPLPMSVPVGRQCQASNCRGVGKPYMLTQMDSVEGEAKKKLYLCDNHAQKARNSYEVTPVDNTTLT